MVSINKYDICLGITIDKLREVGFRDGGYISNIKDPKLPLYVNLYKNIDLDIELSIDDKYGLADFDENFNVFVIDNTCFHIYTPFYDNVDPPIELDNIITSYNSYMDKLVEDGILRHYQNKKYTKKLE